MKKKSRIEDVHRQNDCNFYFWQFLLQAITLSFILTYLESQKRNWKCTSMVIELGKENCRDWRLMASYALVSRLVSPYRESEWNLSRLGGFYVTGNNKASISILIQI